MGGGAGVGEGRGESETPRGDTAPSFSFPLSFQLSGSEVLCTNSSISFFVLTALSPSGFDPDGLDRVRMRECVRARVCACAHSHTGALEPVTGMFLSKS